MIREEKSKLYKLSCVGVGNVERKASDGLVSNRVEEEMRSLSLRASD